MEYAHRRPRNRDLRSLGDLRPTPPSLSSFETHNERLARILGNARQPRHNSLPRINNYSSSSQNTDISPQRYPPPPPGPPPPSVNRDGLPARRRRRSRSRRPTAPLSNPLSITQREELDLAKAIKASLKEQKRLGPKPLPEIGENTQNAPETKHCPICLEEISNKTTGPMSIKAITCGHVFHRKCLLRWDTERRRQGRTEQCPVCRTPQTRSY